VTINALRAEAKAAIAAATPDLETQITFRAAQEHAPLEDQPSPLDPDEATRAFQVIALPSHEHGSFSPSGSHQVIQDLQVTVRYGTYAGWDDAFVRLMDMASADAARISITLRDTTYTTASVGGWRVASTALEKPSPDLAFLTIVYAVSIIIQ
jgi:hypothetical protein